MSASSFYENTLPITASSEEDINASFYQEFTEKFKKITKDHALFHLSFLLLGIFEVLSFLIFFSFLSNSSWLAVVLALLLLSGFAYVVLRFYLECKKPEQLMRLRDHFIDVCKASLPFSEKSKEFHLRVAKSLFQLVATLEDEEYLYYQLPSSFKALNIILKRFSCYLHWKDLFSMKELLTILAIEEQVELIQAFPCDVEAHASLAESYMALCRLFRQPCKSYEKWMYKEASKLGLWQKFSDTALLALEELCIVETLSGQMPWIFAQRASLYHDLERPQEEIQEYERILAMHPGDDEIIFRLGMLYFSEGFSAKGLSCYEKLKNNSDERAQAMMRLYDAKFRSITDSLSSY